MPCARSVGSTRDSLPRLNGSGVVKHAAFTTGFPALTLWTIEAPTDLSQPGTTLGRIVPAPKNVAMLFGAALIIPNGNPLANVVIPVTDHPETSLSASPASARKRLPRPNGNSRT